MPTDDAAIAKSPPSLLNVPMLLTWARIALIPMVVGVFYLPDSWVSPTQKNLFATGKGVKRQGMRLPGCVAGDPVLSQECRALRQNCRRSARF